MAKEIERKYLVRSDEWKSLITKSYPLAQAYLSTDPERTVRVRIKKDKGILTIKGKTSGISRLEFEYEIPVSDAEQLLLLRQSTAIYKTRHEVVFAGKCWEIDVFEAENEGLVLAEIELNEETETFEMPDWIGEEVSHDHRYFNAYLSNHPFSCWTT